MPNLDLIRRLAAKNSELARTQEQLRTVGSKLETWESRKSQELAVIRRRQLSEYESVKASKKKIVDDLIAAKRTGAEQIVDAAISSGHAEFVGKEQMVAVVEKMQEVLPENLVQGFCCADPIVFDDDRQAYKAYAFLDSFASTNGGGTLPTRIFSAITDLLGDITEQQGHAGKVALFIGVLPVVCLKVAPFLFPAVFLCIGCFGVLNGILSRMALRRLYSVREYMSETYDEDLFSKDKTNLMAQVDSFLTSVQQQEHSKIDDTPFVEDNSVLETCEARYAEEKAKLLAQRENLNHLLSVIQADLKDIEKEQEAEREKNKAFAAKVKTQYFTERSWKPQWLDNLVFDIAANDVVESIPWKKCNTLYTFTDSEPLLDFMQLVSFQLMLLEHPNFCRQVILDFKYLGGKVISMAGVSPAVISVNYGEQVESKLQSVHDDIKRRVPTVLQSSPGLEEFNALMQTYGVPGEAYVVVHVCGLSTITPQWLDMLRNGSKVGYFFKFYLTRQELLTLGKQLSLEDFKEFWEVGEHLLPRTENSVKLLISKEK